MARRKPDKAGEGETPVTADYSAKMLEVYAGLILDLAGGGPAEGKTGTGRLNRSETLDLTLAPADRLILLGLPGSGDTLKGRLNIAAGGGRGTHRITVEELAGLF